MDAEKQKRFLIGFLYLLVVIGIAVVFCRVALPVIWPFFVAFLVALLLKPAIRFLREKCRIQKNVAGVVTVLLFYAVVGLVIAFASVKVFAMVKDFVLSLPALYGRVIEPFLVRVFAGLETFTEKLDPAAAAAYGSTLAHVSAEVETLVTNLSKKLLGSVGNTALSVPGGLLNTLIMVIATLFIAVDWFEIKAFVLRQAPEKTKTLLHEIRHHLGMTLGRYIKSYAVILLITFIELSVGLSIVGIPRAVGVAAIVSVFDILPVVGSGTVLLPWTIGCLITGDYVRALGLAIVYVVIVVVRNIIEPKIIGDKVGLHPIVTLMAMVLGTYVFGPIGLLGLPVTLALIKSLNDQGVVHLYQNAPPDYEKGGGDEDDEPKKPAEPAPETEMAREAEAE